MANEKNFQVSYFDVKKKIFDTRTLLSFFGKYEKYMGMSFSVYVPRGKSPP